MAFYKDLNVVRYDVLGPGYETLLPPDTSVPLDGIYRCESCGGEVVMRRGELLPDGHKSERACSTNDMKWRLIVRSEGH